MRRFNFLFRRVAQFVLVTLAASFLISLLLRLLPTDIADIVLPYGDESGKEQLRTELGLNSNPIVTYVKWLGNALQGDLGNLYNAGYAEPVADRIQMALPKTLLLILYAQVFSLLVAIPLAIGTAQREGGRFDRLVTLLSLSLSALPGFAVALILAYFVGVKLQWLPPLGYVPLAEDPVEHFRLIILPVISLSLGLIATYTRLLRTELIAVLKEDYVTMAMSKGLSNRRIMWAHAFRPSSLTLVTSAALNMGGLIGGTIVVEVLFSIPGLGTEIVYAIYSSQVFFLQSTVALIALVYVLFNVIADLIGNALDPRTREVRRG